MVSRCSLGCLKCCFFYCFNSMTISIIEFILSAIGIATNSALFSLTKKMREISNIMDKIQSVKITFFSTSSVTSFFLAILKCYKKIEERCFYKFSLIGSKIFSYLSKILMIVNIFDLFYLISFTHFMTLEVSAEGFFDNTLIDYVGPGKEIEYEVKYIDKEYQCNNNICSSDEKEKFREVFTALFYSLLSIIILLLNGELFLSDSKRIEYLSYGKLDIDLNPIEAVTCLCKREKSFNLLNLLFCYKATVKNIEALSFIFTAILFLISILLLILHGVIAWPQAYFIPSLTIFFQIIISMLNFCIILCVIKCKKKCLKKCCVIIGVILTILCFPISFIGVPFLVGSQNGKIYFKAYCNSVKYDDYEYIYNYDCEEDKDNKYLFITIQSSSGGIIFCMFCIGIIEVIISFYLIILNINLLRDFEFLDKIYEFILFIIDKNGDKICVSDISIRCGNKTYKREVAEKTVQTIKNVESYQNTTNESK